jgi:hypothetical protein
MKKLSLAFACLSLAACGNTPKNEVGKTAPAPQPSQTQAEFEARCFRSDSGGPRGQLNADRSLCRKVVKVIYFGRTSENGPDYELKQTADQELLNGAGAGAMVFGTFEGNAMAPEITLGGVPVARGNLTSPLVTDREGDLRLTAYAGTYKSLNYSVATCFGRGNDYAPCKGF